LPPVAIVTGGGSGIGLAVATRLAEQGYDVALWEIQEQVGQQAAALLASQTGSRVQAFACDVSKRDRVRQATQSTVEQLGTPSVLVNNAAITRPARLEDATEDEWESVLSVNLSGTFYCTQHVGRHFLEAGKGVIINLASVLADNPQVFRANYCSSKAAVLALTRVTALEWGPRGVRCNAVSPGQVRTTHEAPVYADDDRYEQRRRQVPIKRIGASEDIASAVAYLVSDEASYINGANLKVDGGLDLTMMATIPTTGPGGIIVRAVDLGNEATGVVIA
jgi:NAD(P)-dependent dehydrogenase (short-subunit alcohol dehydrogenase family)